MRIEELKLINYRNFKSLNLSFDKINFFYGKNGVGKTNIVEAIAYLTNLSSFRKVEDKDIINSNADFFTIEAKFRQDSNIYHVKVIYSNKGKKVVVNEKQIRRRQDYLSQFITVCFTPQDVFLFKDTKQTRRDFLNDEIVKVSPVYYVSLSSFNKILKNRNDLLKQDYLDESLLNVYTEMIAKYSLEIINKRKEFIKQLELYSNQKYKELTLSNDELKIDYETFIDLENISEKSILDKLEGSLEEDKQKRVTNIGIQKDDFTVYLNGNKIANYGSQGQNRLASIAIKLAMIEIAFKKTGDRPIVILDDVLSELDQEKQKNLLNYVEKENQVFLTSTELINCTCKVFSINEGKIREE